jgi:DnaA family protein
VYNSGRCACPVIHSRSFPSPFFEVQQLAFDFAVRVKPALDNFVVGCNDELVERLHALVRGERFERFIYVWGARASGRTHLALAAIDALQRAGVAAAYHACTADTDPLPALRELDVVAVDDVDRLGKDGEIALFNLYNALRERGGVMIATGPAAPSQLALRADVVSRLAWGLVYEVHALSDVEKAHALADRAKARGFTLQADVSQYLLTHARRDMPALLATLDALDRYSLESKRPVTVPLLRELLADHRRNPN